MQQKHYIVKFKPVSPIQIQYFASLVCLELGGVLQLVTRKVFFNQGVRQGRYVDIERKRGNMGGTW